MINENIKKWKKKKKKRKKTGFLREEHVVSVTFKLEKISAIL